MRTLFPSKLLIECCSSNDGPAVADGRAVWNELRIGDSFICFSFCCSIKSNCHEFTLQSYVQGEEMYLLSLFLNVQNVRSDLNEDALINRLKTTFVYADFFSETIENSLS